MVLPFMQAITASTCVVRGASASVGHCGLTNVLRGSGPAQGMPNRAALPLVTGLRLGSDNRDCVAARPNLETTITPVSKSCESNELTAAQAPNVRLRSKADTLPMSEMGGKRT